MLPFGKTVLAWRLARGLTQAELAMRARLPRPNLSAIERGKREVTLGTLRALALALDVRPGVLADGVPPQDRSRPLSRDDLERVAVAAARGATLTDARLDQLARWLRDAASTRLAAASGMASRKCSPRRAAHAWFQLKTRESAATAASLLDRMIAKALQP